MSKTQNCNNIRSLLDNIVKRTEIIEKQSGMRNFLDIDIAMEDVRLLYRELEVIKKNLVSEVENAEDTYTEHSNTIILKKGVAESKENLSPQLEEKATLNVSQEFVSKQEVVIERPVRETEVIIEPQIQKVERETLDLEIIKAEVPVEPAQVKVSPPAVDLPANPPVVKPINVETKEFLHQPKVEATAEIRQQPIPKSTPEKVIAEKQTIGDKFAGNGNSVHERLAKMKEDKSIATKMQLKPIDNLKTAIGVNEKFIFVNELFNGDLKAYNDSIQILNSSPSIHEAFEFLNRLTTQYSWDGQGLSDTIEKFANLVQRRYMTNM